MAVQFRAYQPTEVFSEDYRLVRAFLLETGRKDYSFGRWDWMTTHPMLVSEALGRIGLWLEDGRLVAIATYDSVPSTAFCVIRPGHESLTAEVFGYATQVVAEGPEHGVMIPDGDRLLQSVAAEAGFIATTQKEADAMYCDPAPTYSLPEGFSITSMEDTFDLRRYDQALYKGFGHEEKDGPFEHTQERAAFNERAMRRPNVDLSLKVAVLAPNGDFVSYCGMWYDPAVDFAIVEPVATDPAYRRMGLGRAAVLEGVRRCMAQGARRAFVGSSQQFYYSIGFRPYQTGTRWCKA